MRGYKGTEHWATDGCGCHDAQGNCYCAECYYYGEDHVNCSNAGAYWYNKDLKPVKWDGSKWVVLND